MNKNPIAISIIWGIKLYRYSLSAILPPSCRFHPSCSEYAMDAIVKHGVLKGLWCTLRRVTKCNPLGNGGYDPV